MNLVAKIGSIHFLSAIRPALLIVILAIPLLFSCKEKTADLKLIDNLISDRNFKQATHLLEIKAQKIYSDSTQYDRINNRFVKIRRKLFFSGLDSLILINDWPNSDSLLTQMQKNLKDSSLEIQKKYFFELYHKKSVVDSALKRDPQYWKDLRNGLKYSFEDRKLIRLKFELLAQNMAEKDSLGEARILFDKSFRMVRYSELSNDLKKAYLFYMDGKFKDCASRLKQIPQEEKDANWVRLENFLNLYSDKLTTENRFKLW